MKDYFLQIKQMHHEILHSSSLESQLAFFRMGRVLLDFWIQLEIAQHFVLGEKSCQLYLPPSLFSYLYFFYASISFNHCGIRMKINAGPAGLNKKNFEI